MGSNPPQHGRAQGRWMHSAASVHVTGSARRHAATDGAMRDWQLGAATLSVVAVKNSSARPHLSCLQPRYLTQKLSNH